MVYRYIFDINSHSNLRIFDLLRKGCPNDWKAVNFNLRLIITP
jgi:hypothetical protein